MDSEAVQLSYRLYRIFRESSSTHSGPLISSPIAYYNSVSPVFIVLHSVQTCLTRMHRQQSTLHTYCKSNVQRCLLWVAERLAVVRVADVTSVLRERAD